MQLPEKVSSCKTHFTAVKEENQAGSATSLFNAGKMRQSFRKLYLSSTAVVAFGGCGTFFVLIALNIYSLLN